VGAKWLGQKAHPHRRRFTKPNLLQLHNSVCNALGDGGLDKVNAMQLLHSVYDLQQVLELDEWRYILTKSSKFVANYDPTIVDDMVPTNASETNQLEFCQGYNKILKLHSQFKTNAIDPEAVYKGTVLQKAQAAILTRWWTVGAAASFTFECYLVIYHASQTIVNVYAATNKAHNIVSSLFSLMSDPENFINLCLIRCFHKGYISPHLDWLQSSADLTNTQAFQSHNVAMRCYLMEYDLLNLLSSTLFKSHFEATEKAGFPRGTTNYDRHLKKTCIFMESSLVSLHNHFKRWLSPLILPAALMSEYPTARVVASLMMNVAAPTLQAYVDAVVYNPGSQKIIYKSEAHGRRIDMGGFNKFLRENVSQDVIALDYTQESRTAAQMVLDGVDFSQMEHDGDVGNSRLFMHSTYLALACQTQFVERMIKEAKHVSTTDRSEEHCRWCAII